MTRRPAPTTNGAPALLAHVLVTASDDGTLTVTVDGTPFEREPNMAAWTRGTFGQLLDTVARDRRTPIRVELRESDGTVFTDIYHAHRPAPAPSSTPQLEPANTDPRARRARQLEVAGSGFAPGEVVEVAAVVTRATATGTGDVRALLDRRALREAGSVVLVGRSSGVVCVRRLG